MAVRAAALCASRCRLYRPSISGRCFRTLSQNVSSSKHTPSETTTEDHHLIYTAEHFALKESIRKIIDQEINPHVDQWEAEGKFPAHKVFKILGNAGVLGVNKPVEYGGLGLDFSYNELKKEFLLPSILGDKVACLGVSEVGAGSDVSSIMTKAVRKGEEFVVNGGKMWTTNGTQADWMCLLANTSDGPPHRNKSLICLPMNLPGIHIARQIDKMGMRSSDTAEVFFDDVRVPCSNVIGQEGMGFTYQMLQFQEERLWAVANYKMGMRSSDTAEVFFDDVRVPCSNVIGQEGMGFTYQMLQFQEERLWAVANSLTTMDVVIQETIEYTRQRKIFKRPVLHHQTVHFRLAELQTEVELLRSLLQRATALYIRGNDVTKLASMAKLKVGRLARELGDSCLQFWGGMGFTNDVLVSRFYRLISIGGGADEVMLGIICKYMDTLPK
ncbi:hypothetical protein CRUP_023488 [Coryphaenoides rupestris]|nr:hypothetical protein CRUP_023488 [Coryphaenoides rupestris]